MKVIALLAVWALGVTAAYAQATGSSTILTSSTAPANCPYETDPNSPRRSRLAGTTASSQIIRTDVDHDGDPDMLDRWWYDRRIRWLDVNDDMKSNDVMGDRVGDTLQVDCDGDGFFDGPTDMTIRWINENGGAKADLMIMVINPTGGAHPDAGRYMVFPDPDHDNVMIWIDWERFRYDSYLTKNSTNKRVKNYHSNFQQDWNGNSWFLWQMAAPCSIADPRTLWENPFCFYDVDRDGCTEMTIRVADDYTIWGGAAARGYRSEQKAFQCPISYDLDNDSQRGNETDFDLTIHFEEGSGFQYPGAIHKHPKVRAPDWILPFFRFTNWLTNDEYIYPAYETCYDQVFKMHWGYCRLTFDEDDDDHRWERVESYYEGDPYSTKRWPPGADKKRKREAGLCGHGQSDSLGDRGEFDTDNSGRGKLYIGRWDKKIHLYGAEWGAWTVDYGALYWGSSPCVGDSSPDNAKQVAEVVQYRDTDGNGFLDEISYDYDGDRTVDLKISLLDYKDNVTSAPDTGQLIDSATARWSGLHDVFELVVEEAWQDAHTLYNAAWKKGFSNSELEELAIASSVAEKYDHAYWIKEKIFRAMDRKLAADGSTKQPLRDRLHRYYFLGDISGVVRLLEESEW